MENQGKRSDADRGEEKGAPPQKSHPLQAAALGFRRGEDRAPRLLAAGEGSLGETIVEIARSHGIPVVSDEALAPLLQALPAGQEIPENLYRAVAAIFALLYSLDAPPGNSSP